MFTSFDEELSTCLLMTYSVVSVIVDFYPAGGSTLAEFFKRCSELAWVKLRLMSNKVIKINFIIRGYKNLIYFSF